jgi:glycosyltransferase involved in cell wall biosynthesis
MDTLSAMPHSPTVHLAHQWWVSHRGGERVLEEFAALFPEAAISTFFLRRKTLTPAMQTRDWRVSPLGRIAPRFIDHRKLLPLYPWATRRLRVPKGTRLLLTSDASLIKGLGLHKPPGCLHVCYCHSPPRYLWDMADDYAARTGGLGGPGRWLFRKLLPQLQRFDREAAARVDHFIANSHFVAARIQRLYGRESVVIHPPVAIERFAAPDSPPDDFYLLVAELVSYKRVDLAIQACAQTGRRLIVAGSGPEQARLTAMAAATEGRVRLVGRVSDEEIVRLMRRCRAFLHPQIEDFGISAVEAQAAGRPVIALRAGGALETVLEGETGLFFDEQTPESLAAALDRFEQNTAPFAPEVCRQNARRFSTSRFREALTAQLHAWGNSGDAPPRH